MDCYCRQRICRVFLGFMFLLALHLGRLYYIQVGSYENYTNKMLNQDTLSVSLEEYPRGNIYDRNMQPFTGTTVRERVLVFPRLMNNRRLVVRRLAEILDFEISLVDKAVKDYPHYLNFDLSPEQIQEINRANLAGVKVAPVTMRYGETPLAQSVIGRLGYLEKGEPAKLANSEKPYKLTDFIGREGLEKYYEKELKGSWPQKVMRAYVDGYGKLIPGLGYRVEKGLPDINRDELVLTLDRRIQEITEMVANARIREGAVVVMDAVSGDILALAGKSAKGYNPVFNLAHPGSVFKIVVAAAALEEGKANPDSVYFCAGEKDKLIKCYYAPGHGNITFAQAMALSCNPTFARVGIFSLGGSKMIAYAEKMGLGSQKIIGYPMPVDKRQNLKLIALPENIRNSSVGQGPVLANPVQIAAMTSVIASGGFYREPRLVREIRNGKGQVVKSFPPGNARRVISATTAEKVNKMLADVVSAGTGKNARVAQGSAGKTGSAEVYDKGQKRIDVWFTGYAPVQNSKYVVTVFMESGVSGGETAAPVFREIMEQILKIK